MNVFDIRSLLGGLSILKMAENTLKKTHFHVKNGYIDKVSKLIRSDRRLSTRVIGETVRTDKECIRLMDSSSGQDTPLQSAKKFLAKYSIPV